MFGRNVIPLEIQKPLYFIGTTWLAVMLYLTLYFLITDFIFLFNRRWRFYRIQVISGYVIVIVLLIIGYPKFANPVVVEQEITIQKNGNNYSELKVLAFSDLHLGVNIDKRRLKKYVQLINEQQPDIILIAGDMIDNNLLPLNQERMYKEMKQMQAPLGVYVCLGNHEYLSGIEGSLDFLKKSNLTLLVDSAVLINDSFWLIGRDDRIKENRKSIQELVAQTNPEQSLILLNHQPFFLEETVENGIDLQFSGHTHGGQLFPINLIVNQMFEVAHGYAKKGNTHIYVSSGLALWGPLYRIGTQSEIVVFNIHFKE
jgi:predicted MPP superfamily phosphohydrolase